jgi:Zn-dependent protease with chaperone function
MAVAAPVPVPPNTPEAIAFTHQGELIWVGLHLLTVAVAAALLFSGLGARVRATLDRITGARSYPTLVLFACTYLIADTALSLPLRWIDAARWSQWARLGFKAPDPAAWFTGRAASLALECAAVAALIWIPYALMRRRPRTWWLWLTAVGVPALVAGLLLWQVVLLPLTTRFEPLGDSALSARIDAIAARCGAGRPPVLVGGDDETVVGLGPSSRILIPPWLLKQQTPDQFVSGVAHELKHYRMGDNWLALGVVAALVLIGALLVHVFANAAVSRWGPRLGLRSLDDPATLPLIVLVLAIAWPLAGLPAFNAIQRHVEHEADRFALEVTRDNRALSESQATVARQPWRMVDEDAFTRIFLDNHPSAGERIRFGNDYRPWEHGQPGVYDRVCAPPA